MSETKEQELRRRLSNLPGLRIIRSKVYANASDGLLAEIVDVSVADAEAMLLLRPKE